MHRRKQCSRLGVPVDIVVEIGRQVFGQISCHAVEVLECFPQGRRLVRCRFDAHDGARRPGDLALSDNLPFFDCAGDAHRLVLTSSPSKVQPNKLHSFIRSCQIKTQPSFQDGTHPGGPSPNVETLGYCRMSLRDTATPITTMSRILPSSLNLTGGDRNGCAANRGGGSNG